MKFDARVRKKAKESGATLLCQDCETRKSKLEKILRQADSWNCTCPKSGQKRKHVHTNEKCQLASTRAGEKRWPGSNNGVTRGDLSFLRRVQSTSVPESHLGW